MASFSVKDLNGIDLIKVSKTSRSDKNFMKFSDFGFLDLFLDVWTCILGVWACILGVRAFILGVRAFILGVRAFIFGVRAFICVCILVGWHFIPYRSL